MLIFRYIQLVPRVLILCLGYAVSIRILLNVVIQSGGVLTTCVMSLVLFLPLFNFVLLQARTGCSVRYCVLAVRELV